MVDAFDRVRRLYAFQRVEMPVFEATEVFARSIGETTDIVSKEMYTFPDRGGDLLTLRPEFTAGICRAYLSEGWQQHAPLKLATHGPVFRYERPQKGRFRQFHQLDAEIIGTDAPAADVELLALADQLLRELGIADGVTLQLNTLGDAATREAWRAALVEHFEAHRDRSVRGEPRPAREESAAHPRQQGSARPPDRRRRAGDRRFPHPRGGGLLRRGHRRASTRPASPGRAMPGLVRGLDYYRHTAFEFVTDRLGAQGAVIAGGRYDGLIESLGGPPTPAVGWAAGIERLAMMIEAPAQPGSTRRWSRSASAAETRGGADRGRAAPGRGRLRHGLSGEHETTACRRPSDSGARYAIILGDDELDKAKWRSRAWIGDRSLALAELVPVADADDDAASKSRRAVAKSMAAGP